MSSAAESDLLIGVGCATRRDDGVGVSIAEGVRRRGRPAIAHEGDGAALLDLWAATRGCVVVDALSGGPEPGAVRVFADLDDPAIAEAAFVRSTHQIGLPEAVRLGRALGRLPARLIIVGVAGADFGRGRGLSPVVAATAERLVDRLSRAADILAAATEL